MLAFFNTVRGYRAGILRQSDYTNLTQCETLDGTERAGRRANATHSLFLLLEIDLKLHLASTDYGNFLQNEPSPIATATIAEVTWCSACALMSSTKWHNPEMHPQARG